MIRALPKDVVERISAALSAGFAPEAMKAMWSEFRGLAMAAQELTRNGSQAQQERASQQFSAAKAQAYAAQKLAPVVTGNTNIQLITSCRKRARGAETSCLPRKK